MQMDAKGQSLLEVVFVLPFLFLFVTVLFKMNLAINSAINNTQYARSQVFSLTANSPEYPRLEFRLTGARAFATMQQDLMVLGVADPSAISGSASGGMDPIPQTIKIDKTGQNFAKKGVKVSNEPGEQASRNEIRIRNTAAICTQLNNSPLSGSARWPFKQMACGYQGAWIGDAGQ